MRVRGRIAHAGALAACCGALFATAEASASSLTVGYGGDETGHELWYTAAPGEANAVTYWASGGSPASAERITIRDTGAVIDYPAGAPCIQRNPHEITCSFSVATEAHQLGQDVVNCATGPLPPAGCDVDVATRGFGQLMAFLGDDDDSLETAPDTVPLQTSAFGEDGADRIHLRGEFTANISGGEGGDTLRIGELEDASGLRGSGHIAGFGGTDRIDVRNGTPGDRLRCGDGADPMPKVDPGDLLGQSHGCEHIPPGAVVEP